ncbi:PEP/pyruvate-binding domain-containing protein [Isoptericola cucumis]|uniref:PEP/pyruvate-binding domain-containing protein n=1 Tax=Isoptericola cucumis TaxID=1776856 RepID=UPI003208C226
MGPIVPLADARPHDAGAKAATLGRLRRAGLPVPDGVVVPADADLSGAGVQELAAALDRLGGGPFAVRSSAADEDGAGASAAGQYDSVLGASGIDAVVAAVHACRASAAGPRATAYRAARGRTEVAGVAVLVQHTVVAHAAGVMFTPDPGLVPGEPAGVVVIEAAWGLGQSVVQGAVDPDRFTVTAGQVGRRHVGSKHTRVDGSSHGTTTRDVAPADRRRPCLDDDGVLRVAGLGARVAALLGGAQDVEWAVDAAGTVWLLQARPVTAALPATDRAPARGRTGVLHGVAGSGGRAHGPARVVRGPDDFAAVRPGDVLVCRETDPAWTPLFGVVAAVVTETGGLLSHAAIVAREAGLPAVLGVPRATEALRGTVAVDGDAGTVEVLPARRAGQG